MRRAHILKKGSKYKAARHILLVDTEARIEEVDNVQYHSLRLGLVRHVSLARSGRYVTRGDYYFTTVDEFWSILARFNGKRMKYSVYAHNFGYDSMLLGLFTAEQRGYTIHRVIVSPQVFFMILWRGSNTYIFRDTTCYVRSSLAVIGDIFGLKKLEVDYRTVDDTALREYLARDVDILMKLVVALLTFVHEHDFGDIGVTAPQLAFNTYRYRFMTHNIYIHTNDRVTAMERDAYYGGRVESFRLGEVKERVYQLDINSQYPYVMRENEYPTRLLWTTGNATVEKLRELIGRGYGVIATVVVKPMLPCIPSRRDGKLVFTLEEQTVSLCTPELRLALEKGYVSRVIYTAVYEMKPIFRDYVDYLYGLRMTYKAAGNEPFQLFTKLLMNSLYGKFGQRRPQYVECNHAPYSEDEIVIEWSETDEGSNEVRHYRQVGSKVFIRVGDDEAYNSFAAIAAHVTSYARVYLWRLMNEAGCSNVLYLDTDSLFVAEAGYKRLLPHIDKATLGKLKLEQAGDGIRINGLKDYDFCGRTKLKGIRKNARRLDENVYQQEQFLSALSCLKRGETERVIVETRTKVLRRVYDKGIVVDNVVFPFGFNPDSHAQVVRAQPLPPR